MIVFIKNQKGKFINIRNHVFINFFFIENELVSEGLALTTAENLNCQFILHLDTETQNESWEEKINKCLLKIENSNVGQSMAFPTLGQGKKTSPRKSCSRLVQLYNVLFEHLYKNCFYFVCVQTRCV